MINLNNKYLYAKGTCNVVLRDIATGDVVLQSNKVNSNNLTTSVDLGEVRTGLGYAIAIQIPSNAAVNLEIDLANFSMTARAMQVGTHVAYNGVSPACESITATSATLTIAGEAVAPYGYKTAIANVVEQGAVNASGTAYTIDATGKVIGFTATIGKVYAVTYFTRNASAEWFNISSNFAPGVYHVTTQIAVYSTENTSNANQGTLAGYLYHIIPRMQFSGNANTDGGQTTNVVSSLTGTALSYDDASAMGICTDCAIAGLAQVVYVPVAGAGAAVADLVIVGGGVNVTVGNSAQVPVLYLMPDGSTVQPNYGDMTFTKVGSAAAFSVNATGLVNGSAAGSGDIKVALKNTSLTAVCNVTVTA